MNTRKLFYAFLTFALLSVAACSNDSGDDIYEGVEKSKIKVPGRSVEKSKIVVPGRDDSESVEKSKIIINKD
ncbi:MULTISPECIES: hypothetical protein [unclassified Robiginitalea]|uniref:hypothetical protein n=1 Tax=Flavobacteriaceae TaxID=49546 RepID=UPI00234964B5|nr:MULTISPECIES: hypothetical protein [unclassified Robiginitalea]MDC6354123.1 hypothetical protein [Robiginitalea sp. PM2]MDC6374390.1 hypothetical protein [Robiginitalea sp. SP8]